MTAHEPQVAEPILGPTTAPSPSRLGWTDDDDPTSTIRVILMPIAESPSDVAASSDLPPYRVLALVEERPEALGVTQLKFVFADRYDSWPHRVSRLLARSYTALLRWYLARSSHIDFQHSHNWARKISFLPYGFRSWSGYIPGGHATYYVYQPHHRKMANGKRLDPVTNGLFRHCLEGVGMRTRAYILSWLVQQWAQSQQVPVRWLSIGCGSGQPTFDASKRLPSDLRSASQLVLVDRDQDVLDFARALHREQHHELPACEYRRLDFLDSGSPALLSTDGQYQIIDAMGVLEYLDHPRSVQFIRQCYELLDPNGILVFSNMDEDRPDYDINQRVIGWPRLNLRSPEEILRAIDDAGVPRQAVTLARAADGVNNIIQLRKNQ